MKSPLDKLEFRGNDPTGHGYYGAKRGEKKHRGVDLVAKPNACVYSPIHGVITRVGQVYTDDITDKFKLIEIKNDIYRIKLMYVLLDIAIIGQRIFEENYIGRVQDVASFWDPKMINHIHFEVYKHGLLTDPEPLLICKKYLRSITCRTCGAKMA